MHDEAADDDFLQILRRVRDGDHEAASALAQSVEPRIHAAIHHQIDELKLRRLLDSGDISQSVLARFFLLAAEGQFDLSNPEQLAALLITMARNRLRDEARREFSLRRGNGRSVKETDHLLAGLTTTDPTPSRTVSAREITDELFARLPPDVRYLAEQRALGREWSELAEEVGGSPQSLRKKMARAIEKIARDLDLL